VNLWRRLFRDRNAVGFLEFALAMPLVLGFCMSGLEMANCLVQINKAQRLASMLADLMGQQGQGGITATEAQVYDLFSALKVSAQPIDMVNNGRVVITIAQGVDVAGNGVIINKFVNQQFDGGLLSAKPLLGCHSTQSAPTFNPARSLAKDEIIIHAQVTFAYKPLFIASVYDLLTLPSTFTQSASYRARRSDFAIQPQSSFPMKTNCETKDGLPTTSM
jgi:Flp pilus assembly protein TadG